MQITVLMFWPGGNPPFPLESTSKLARLRSLKSQEIRIFEAAPVRIKLTDFTLVDRLLVSFGGFCLIFFLYQMF